MFAREVGVTFSSPPRFSNALYYSEDDHVSLTTDHLLYILPMNLNNVSTCDFISRQDKVIKAVGVTEEVVFPSVLPDDAVNKFSGHTFRHATWSCRGGAPNGGCLLATVCTDGKITVYRPPAVNDNLLAVQRWVEVADIYSLLFEHCSTEEFKNNIIPITKPKVTRVGAKRKSDGVVDEVSYRLFLKNCFFDSVYISGGEAIRRTYMLETLSLCWSPLFPSASSSSNTRKQVDIYLALGGKSKITMWKCRVPVAPPYEYNFKFSHSIDTGGQWVSTMAWKGNKIASAFVDGSVKIWEVSQGDVNTKVLFKLAADMVYPSSVVWIDNNLWIAKGQAIVKVSEDGKVTQREGAHTNLTKAMSYCAATKQLITLAEDGTIKAWDPDSSQVLWERGNEPGKKNLGWFGVAASPMGRYMIAIEQVSGFSDKMYKARNATAKFWTIPTGDTRPLSQVLVEHVKSGTKESIWDVVEQLAKEHDPTVLLGITSALEKYYYQQRPPKEQKANVRALSIANVLYEKAVYVDEKETLEQIQTQKQKNILEIVTRYIETAFSRFKQSEKRLGDDFALQLTDRELVCLKNMHSWIGLFAPQLLKLAAQVAQHVEHRPIVEKCPFCSHSIPFTSHLEAECENKHSFVRCTRTFLALSSPVLWHNPFTNTKSLVFDFEREDRTPSQEFTWIVGDFTPSTHPRCPLYDVPFLRFAPTLLEKLDRDKMNALENKLI